MPDERSSSEQKIDNVRWNGGCETANASIHFFFYWQWRIQVIFVYRAAKINAEKRRWNKQKKKETVETLGHTSWASEVNEKSRDKRKRNNKKLCCRPISHVPYFESWIESETSWQCSMIGCRILSYSLLYNYNYQLPSSQFTVQIILYFGKNKFEDTLLRGTL